MDLKKQVCSYQLAKRLKELGFDKDSYFAYFNMPHNRAWEVSIQTKNKIGLPAYTVAELGEALPDWTETVKRLKDDWVCIVRHKHNDINDHSFDETEADARAKMLIHLIENELIP